MKPKWKYVTAAALIGLGIGIGVGWFAVDRSLRQNYEQMLENVEKKLFGTAYTGISRLVVAQGDIFWSVEKDIHDAVEDELIMAELKGLLNGMSNYDFWLGATSVTEGFSSEAQDVLDPLLEHFYVMDRLLAEKIPKCGPEHADAVAEYCENLYLMLSGRRYKDDQGLFDYVTSNTVTDTGCATLIFEIESEMNELTNLLEEIK